MPEKKEQGQTFSLYQFYRTNALKANEQTKGGDEQVIRNGKQFKRK